MQDYQTRIRSCDPSVFFVPNETHAGDKTTILRVLNLVASRTRGYNYVETGSYMGGSLVPHLLDDRCEVVVSIDLRPDLQPDERGVSFNYTRSSTKVMIDKLRERLPESCLTKLKTFDGDASNMPDFGVKFDFCFIDGEHTNIAAFNDFLSLWRWCAPDCVVLFHDMNLIGDAISNVESFLTYQRVKYRAFCLPNVVFAILVGSFADECEELEAMSFPKREYFAGAKNQLWLEIAKSRAHLFK